jgi:predicted lipoprotein with Yx(FWY)xxD motif
MTNARCALPLFFVAWALAVLLVSACIGSTGWNYGGAPPASPAPTTGTLSLRTAQGSHGAQLTDGQGRSVYVFLGDTPGVSNCNGACAAAWPPVILPGGSAATTSEDGVDQQLVGMFQRTDGSTQLTFNEMPLYYCAGDTAAGQDNGEGALAFGALWYLVMPDGTVLR